MKFHPDAFFVPRDAQRPVTLLLFSSRCPQARCSRMPPASHTHTCPPHVPDAEPPGTRPTDAEPPALHLAFAAISNQQDAAALVASAREALKEYRDMKKAKAAAAEASGAASKHDAHRSPDTGSSATDEIEEATDSAPCKKQRLDSESDSEVPSLESAVAQVLSESPTLGAPKVIDELRRRFPKLVLDRMTTKVSRVLWRMGRVARVEPFRTCTCLSHASRGPYRPPDPHPASLAGKRPSSRAQGDRAS